MKKQAVLFAAALVLAACGRETAQEQARDEKPDPAPAPHVSMPAPTPDDVATRIAQDADEETIDVRVGTKIAVELIGLPTAGYMWGAVETPAFLSPAGETGGPTSEAQLEAGYTGGNHWEVFMFDVEGEGRGELRFEQRRMWEDDQPATDAFAVTINARAEG